MDDPLSNEPEPTMEERLDSLQSQMEQLKTQSEKIGYRASFARIGLFALLIATLANTCSISENVRELQYQHERINKVLSKSKEPNPSEDSYIGDLRYSTKGAVDPVKQ